MRHEYVIFPNTNITPEKIANQESIQAFMGTNGTWRSSILGENRNPVQVAIDRFEVNVMW